VNNNRPSRDAVDRIMTENGSYYIIGYELPPRRRASENWRRIEVRVNRRGVDVRARSRFIDAPIQARPPISALRDAITGVMPKQGLPLRVVVAPLALDAEPGGSVVAVSVGVSDRNAQPDLNDVEMLVAAFDAEGRERETIHSKGAVTLRPGTEEGAEFELHAGIPLRPGNYQLRVGVRNNRSGSTGSVYTTVDVPQFFKSSLSLSGLVVSASPTVPANRSEELGRQLPVVPTTRRTFSPADRVSVFARLYQPVTEPRTINAVATVVDARNASVFRRELNASGKDFVRGAADLHLDVPVSFAPGQYLFALEIQAPKGNIRRTMRFTIR
jgi:hypothetical protein